MTPCWSYEVVALYTVPWILVQLDGIRENQKKATEPAKKKRPKTVIPVMDLEMGGNCSFTILSIAESWGKTTNLARKLEVMLKSGESEFSDQVHLDCLEKP